MNIDKDIEILSNMQGFLSSCEVCSSDCDKDPCNDLKAINNILADRETWKKIAEFLADKGNFDHYSYCESNIFSCNAKTPKKTCKQCIIDWARKEVKNGKNSSSSDKN